MGKLKDKSIKELLAYKQMIDEIYNHYANLYEMNRGNAYGDTCVPTAELKQYLAKTEIYKAKKAIVLDEMEKRIENEIE